MTSHDAGRARCAVRGIDVLNNWSTHGFLDRSGRRDERSYFFDTLAEYQWARDAAGLMPSSIDQLVKPVIELWEHYDVVPWQLAPAA
ncbi:hypothetical protein OIE52_47385 [Streptomyces canus]|uniref:hypothetical protein n=1 Tax=Streptomyces canus TaxID=58343 RepID=UPI002E2B9188|nr:hypothetical protein [Streptomyces canus]